MMVVILHIGEKPNTSGVRGKRSGEGQAISRRCCRNILSQVIDRIASIPKCSTAVGQRRHRSENTSDVLIVARVSRAMTESRFTCLTKKCLHGVEIALLFISVGPTFSVECEVTGLMTRRISLQRSCGFILLHGSCSSYRSKWCVVNMSTSIPVYITWLENYMTSNQQYASSHCHKDWEEQFMNGRHLDETCTSVNGIEGNNVATEGRTEGRTEGHNPNQ